jgi:hypothetical protein
VQRHLPRPTFSFSNEEAIGGLRGLTAEFDGGLSMACEWSAFFPHLVVATCRSMDLAQGDAAGDSFSAILRERQPAETHVCSRHPLDLMV